MSSLYQSPRAQSALRKVIKHQTDLKEDLHIFLIVFYTSVQQGNSSSFNIPDKNPWGLFCYPTLWEGVYLERKDFANEQHEVILLTQLLLSPLNPCLHNNNQLFTTKGLWTRESTITQPDAGMLLFVQLVSGK